MLSKTKFLLVVVLASLLATGCYWNADVLSDQVGVKLHRNAVVECLGPGVWSSGDWWDDLRTISVATITFDVGDPEVATKDNQLVGVDISIQARRKADCDSVKGLLANWTHLLDDTQLQDTIDATAREGIKNGTRGFTLTELLDDRDGLADAIRSQLEEDAAKYHAEIVNVTIENVAIASEYASVLQATAKLKADEDFQRRRQALIEQEAATNLFERQQEQKVLAEQLLVEQAQTAVDVEIAERRGKVIAAQNQVYAENQQAFELKKLELLAQVFGDKAVYFLPEGTDLSFLLDLVNSGKIPIPVQPAPEPAQ